MSHRINGGSMRFIWYDETVFPNLERAFPIWGTMLAALGMLCPSPNKTIPSMIGRVLLNSELGSVWVRDKENVSSGSAECEDKR